MTKIVVGVDGSSSANAALRFALREAQLRQAKTRVVIAWHVPASAYGGVGFTSLVNLSECFREDAEQTLAGVRESIGQEAERPEIEWVAREGRAASVLIEEASDADLLVVGSRGHGGFAGLLLGSVSSECAHHAPCPIVIVNEKSSPRGGVAN